MKEMTIEQKAKRLDEALEGAKILQAPEYKNASRDEILERLFPELNESEDERIRTTLIAYFKDWGTTGNTKFRDIDIDLIIAWLEKQKREELPNIYDRPKLEDYAYQVAYDLSNDWARETPTWKDVQVACKLGAKWQEEHKPVELSEEKHELMKKCVNKAYNQGYETGFEMCRQEMTHGNECIENKLEIARGEGYKQGKRDGLKEAIETADETCWKPSVEQIKALEYQIANTGDGWQKKATKEVLKYLKQLKGE